MAAAQQTGARQAALRRAARHRQERRAAHRRDGRRTGGEGERQVTTDPGGGARYAPACRGARPRQQHRVEHVVHAVGRAGRQWRWSRRCRPEPRSKSGRRATGRRTSPRPWTPPRPRPRSRASRPSGTNALINTMAEASQALPSDDNHRDRGLRDDGEHARRRWRLRTGDEGDVHEADVHRAGTIPRSPGCAHRERARRCSRRRQAATSTGSSRSPRSRSARQRSSRSSTPVPRRLAARRRSARDRSSNSSAPARARRYVRTTHVGGVVTTCRD